MRNRVVMRLYFNVIVDAEPADPPFGKTQGLSGKGLECWPISSDGLRRVTQSRRIGRLLVERVSNSAIAALTSARL
jgi:hypothetical protein